MEMNQHLRKLFNLFVSFCFLTNITRATDSQYFVKVKHGDSLAMILSTVHACPLYGKNQSVQKTIQLNKNSIDSQGNILIPYSTILLPISTLSQSKDYTVSNQLITIKRLNAKNCSTKKSKQRKIASDSSEQQSSNHSEYKIDSENTFDPISWIGISPQFSFLRINGKDLSTQGTAVILSNLNIGGALIWRQEWSEMTKSQIDLALMKIKLYPSSTKSITDNTHTLTHFGFGLNHSLNTFLYIGFDIIAEQVLTFYTISSNELKLPLATIFKAGPKLGFILAKVKNLSLNSEFSARYLANTSTSEQTFSGGMNDYQGKLILRHTIKNAGIEGAISYQSENLKSNLISEQIVNLNFELAYYFKFGENSSENKLQ